VKLDLIGDWNESNLHYRYIMNDDVTMAGVQLKTQGADFWQNHCKKMFGSIPTEINANMMMQLLNR
jgi:hypothetical protein